MLARRAELECASSRSNTISHYHAARATIHRRSSDSLPTDSLPFVYALWLIRPEIVDSKSIANNLRALRDENIAHLDELITAEEFDPEFCARYYRGHLRFSFGEREKEGLRIFANLCEKYRLLPKRDLAFSFV